MRNAGSGDTLPIRGVRVELWDYDQYSGDDLLGYDDSTDGSGYFTIPACTTWEGTGDRQDIYLKFYAQNEAAVVKQSHNGATYVVQTPTKQECPSGVYDTTIVLSTAESGAFFVAEAVLTGRDKWLQLRSDKNPGQVQVVLSAGVAPYDGSYFDTTLQYIHIETSDDTTNQWPDTFDKDVVFHEYGHRLEWLFDFLDASPGGDHGWRIPFCDTCSLARSRAGASSEGFSHWWACYVKDSPRWWNITNSFHDTLYYDLETGLTGRNGIGDDDFSPTNAGSRYEASYAGILWDIWDQQNDDFTTFNLLSWLPRPDGTGDTLWLQTAAMLSTLVDRTWSGHHPDDSWDFWAAWHNSPTLGHTKGLRDVYYEHGDDIFVSCCIGVRGNVNMIGIVDQSDQAALLNFLTGGGYVLPCPSEANVNGVGIIDLSDLTALINYLTGGGYVLPACGP